MNLDTSTFDAQINLQPTSENPTFQLESTVQAQTDMRTLHSPIDSWSFHLEFIWQGAQPNFCLFPPGFHLDS